MSGDETVRLLVAAMRAWGRRVDASVSASVRLAITEGIRGVSGPADVASVPGPSANSGATAAPAPVTGAAARRFTHTSMKSSVYRRVGPRPAPALRLNGAPTKVLRHRAIVALKSSSTSAKDRSRALAFLKEHGKYVARWSVVSHSAYFLLLL